MNSVLRDVARRLRYRPLPDVVGHTLTIRSLTNAISEIEHNLASLLPGLQFGQAIENNTAGSIAKYGIIDLTFNVQAIDWDRRDAPGIPLLLELGFVISPSEIPDDEKLTIDPDEDPTCLEALRKEINENQNVLRVFIEERPRRDLQKHMTSMMSSRESTDKVKDTFLSGYFPKEFVVKDACLTNSAFVWFHKHFWM